MLGVAGRFNEWGRACKEYQLESLKSSSGGGHQYFFTGYYRPTSAPDCNNLKSDISGSFMTAPPSKIFQLL